MALFKLGREVFLNLLGGPLLKTLLTRAEPCKMFIQEAKLFLARVVMTHPVNQNADKTYATFQTEIRGLLSFSVCMFARAFHREKDSC